MMIPNHARARFGISVPSQPIRIRSRCDWHGKRVA